MRGAIPPLPNTPSWRGTELRVTTLPLRMLLYLSQNIVHNLQNRMSQLYWAKFGIILLRLPLLKQMR
jgi:hypothetical protein